MPDSDDDALFAELENEDDSNYRTQRIQQLNAELSSQKTNRDANPRGATLVSQDSTYPTLDNDQSVLDFTTQTSRCIMHFAHQDFARCAVMDSKLEEFAGRHYEVRIARVDVRNTPFLVEKLGIRVLPCVIGFKDGVGVEKVVGFEGLGSDGKGGFSLKVLEKRLLSKDVLSQAKFSEGDEDDIRDESGSENEGRRVGKTRKAIRSGNTGLRGRDDDDEWD